jgi:hypothetical protein
MRLDTSFNGKWTATEPDLANDAAMAAAGPIY